MRVIMMLRPTDKHGTKGAYTAFRKRLVTEGFVLVQPEVFMLTTPTRRSAEFALSRLADAAPTTGTVCAMLLTERQAASVRYLVGEAPYQERSIGAKRLVTL